MWKTVVSELSLEMSWKEYDLLKRNSTNSTHTIATCNKEIMKTKNKKIINYYATMFFLFENREIMSII